MNLLQHLFICTILGRVSKRRIAVEMVRYSDNTTCLELIGGTNFEILIQNINALPVNPRSPAGPHVTPYNPLHQIMQTKP